MKRMVICAAVLLTGCVSAASSGGASGSSNAGHAHASDAGRVYLAARDGRADAEAAFSKAAAEGDLLLVVLGANWCHDSRGLAEQLSKGRLRTLMEDHYEVVFVDVGMRERNLDIAAAYGIDGLEGTPTVVVAEPTGEGLGLRRNSVSDARSWRNADSRSEADIYAYFQDHARGR